MTQAEYNALDDRTALADVRIPKHPPPPKEYTPEGRAEWANELAYLYPDGIVIHHENPLLNQVISEFDPDDDNGAAFWTLLEAGTSLSECCKLLGVDQTRLGHFLSWSTKKYTAGQFFLLEEMVLSGDPYRMADLTEATGLAPTLTRKLVAAIGPRHEWLTPEGAQLTYTYATRDAILSRVAEGESMKALGEEYGIKYDTVVKMVRTHREKNK